jgi:hypothetical protein
MDTSGTYPVSLTVEYPERDLDRVTTFFRVFTAIPAWVIAWLLTATFGKGLPWLFLPTLLMLVFRQKYPRWWFDWVFNLSQFLARVGAYSVLLTDVYPATDERQGVRLTLPYPDAAKDLDRWLPLFKWFLAIPHFVVLVFVNLAALLMVLVAWVAILLTGRFPKEIFAFVVGAARWNFRVLAYAFLLVTDDYPPFQLAE